MKINQVIKTLELMMGMEEQVVTPFLMGPPGIGKSQIVKQVANKLGYETVLDIRLSQHDSTDVKGIPYRSKSNELEWLAPEFMPIKGSKYDGTKGVLFFDELNRASNEVLQSVFEVVLDRSIGMKSICDGWFVIAAGNQGIEDDTNVVEMDAALLNRFQMIDVEKPDAEEWTIWANSNNVLKTITKFIEKFPKFLYYKEDGNLITPRSWEKFSNVLQKIEGNYSQSEATILFGKTIISVATPEFFDFVKNFEIAVSPKDILYNFNNKEIISRIERMDRHQLHSMSQQVLEYLDILADKELVKEAFNEVMKNLQIFIENYLNSDHLATFIFEVTKKKYADVFFKEYLEVSPEANEEGSELNKIISQLIYE